MVTFIKKRSAGKESQPKMFFSKKSAPKKGKSVALPISRDELIRQVINHHIGNGTTILM